MSKLTRENAILPIASSVDLTGKEGCLVVFDAGNLILATDPSESVFGVIQVGAKAGIPSSIAVCAGGLAGTVKIKLADPVTAVGTLLMAGGETGEAYPASGTAPNKVFAQALETGVADEQIEAVLFKPIAL